MPDVFSEGKGFSYVFFCFAFIQTKWYQGAQKLESSLENMNQSINVTRAEGTGIKCLHSEPRTCSWACKFFFCIRITFLSHQKAPTAQFFSECGNVRKRHQFKWVHAPLSELPHVRIASIADCFVLLSDL